ncbi:nitrate transporter [Ophiostoma piceae UAMH 11346]|uniref:Nitrate transporter n=1 Tax=Ophiostoma piceae (strain UAMH 11346) TaxID=1262450 RepID=S3BZA3_OPHP1|nr:nitrate transporter [Ophiostoma piceae UAMH 11346]
MAGFRLADLYRAPDVNPINQKARAIPVLNPIDPYGRVFFFSWFGFMVAFWAWYAFPPLLTVTIKHDLNLSTAQVANSNIVSLVATLVIRIVSGPLCDYFGPRRVFGGMLLVGAIPTGLAPLIKDATGLYLIRFFMGILGGSFVPCQVWTTAFFDKNVVGSANALAGGFGNAGGGITYFIMPAVFDSLIGSGSYKMLATANGEVVQDPNMSEVLKVTFSLQTFALMLTYMCSFGGELAINAVLSSYYLYNFPQLGQTGATRWAAMFGFLNFVTRPSGGAVADALYRMGSGVGQSRFKHHHRLWFKRHWITMCGILGGGALVLVGKVIDPQRTGHPPSEAVTFVLIALSAVFLEAGNGANFALVPHVHPQANGIVSGLTGAAGNLGGVIFSIIFRFVTHKPAPGAPSAPNYGKSFWIIGVIHIVANAAVSWVKPIPKDQIGGH